MHWIQVLKRRAKRNLKVTATAALLLFMAGCAGTEQKEAKGTKAVIELELPEVRYQEE